MCYYFVVIILWVNDNDFSDILLDEKLCKKKYENILIFDILYKTSTSAKPLHIRFNKIDVFIKIHYKIRHLVLLDYSYCEKICDKITYLINEKVVLYIVYIIIILQESELTEKI